MQRRVTIAGAVTAAALLVACATHASPCEIACKNPPMRGHERADARRILATFDIVVVVRVERLEEPRDHTAGTPGQAVSNGENAVAHLRVLQHFKGPRRNTVRAIARPSEECGVTLEAGRSYLLVAHGAAEPLWPDPCQTRPRQLVEPLLAELRGAGRKGS